MQSKTTFSIITPVYNGLPFLNILKSALQKQTYGAFEWIVINDGSDDASEAAYSAIAGDAAFPIKVITVENGGQGRARNIGISNASGRWLCPIDVDDPPYPEKLETIHSWINNTSSRDSVIGCHGLYVESDDRGRLHPCRMPFGFADDHLFRKRQLRQAFKQARNVFPNSGLFYSRGLLDTHGIRYCEAPDCIGVEDFIFNMTALDAADEVIVKPTICGKYMIHSGNISSPGWLYFHRQVCALERIAELLDFQPYLPEAISNACISQIHPSDIQNLRYQGAALIYGARRVGTARIIRTLLGRASRVVFSKIRRPLKATP